VMMLKDVGRAEEVTQDVRDVAEMLGLPEGTVKSHLHRARHTLGLMLE
jgi:hypothetical protein